MKKFIKVIGYIVLIILIAGMGIGIARKVNSSKTEKLREVKDESLEATKYLKGFNREDYTLSKLENVDVIKVDNGKVQGYHFKPKEIKKEGTVIIFSGSDGGIDIVRSSLLSQKGYDVYAMYYFGAKNQEKELSRIDINIFEDIIKEIKKEKSQLGPVTLVGSSKGAELSLLLSNYYKIDNLILYSPSSYIWQGLSQDYKDIHSSWLKDGKEIKYLSTSKIGFPIIFGLMKNGILNKPLDIGKIYEYVIENTENIDSYLIAMDNVKANVLIFAGEKDRMWPSYEMGQVIKDKLKDKAELISYKNAGHIFFGPSVYEEFYMGGEYKANLQALIDSNDIVLDRLNKWTK
ncbi:MAG: alpha/beta hydrolase family protein [Peptoniphilaceae bacterium]